MAPELLWLHQSKKREAEENVPIYALQERDTYMQKTNKENHKAGVKQMVS